MNILRKILASPWAGGLFIGLLAWVIVVATLDPSGSYPGLIQGPGVTIDEVLNVQQGVLLVEVLNAYGIWILDPVNVREIFGEGGVVPYLSDYPPLGRLLLGLGHHAMWSVAPPESPVGFTTTACARFASATLFAMTVFLIGATAGSWFGRSAGWFAAISVLLMPRVFAHAHLASLESVVNLTYALAVLCLADRWGGLLARQNSSHQKQSPPQLTWKYALLPGVMLGLALLTKIQGFLVIPPIILWALWNWRQHAIVPLIVFGGLGGLVFFCGWPWLWLDPLGHLLQYLGSATDRISLNVFYFGRRYADTQTPWHYPWVMFATTVPLGLHLLGVLGSIMALKRQVEKPRMILVLMCILFPLCLFSTQAAIYDGTRLFLMIYPLWGLFIGLGAMQIWDWLREKKSPRLAWTATVLFFLLQSWGLISIHPCQLSYYNLLAGGLRGANSIGLERTYWSDSITRSFLQECVGQIPENSIIEVAPVLHQFQLEEMETQSPIVRSQGWKFRPYSTDPETSNSSPLANQDRYVIIFYRQADLPEQFRIANKPPETSQAGSPLLLPIVEQKREGVLLAALFKLQQNRDK